MHRTRTLVALGAAAVVAATAIAPLIASAQSDIDELLTGLNSPKGVALFGRDVVVGQGAFGPPDPVLLYITGGRDRGATIPVTEPSTLSTWRSARSMGPGWGIRRRTAVLVHQLADGTVVEVLDIAGVPGDRSGPGRPGRLPEESNAYGSRSRRTVTRWSPTPPATTSSASRLTAMRGQWRGSTSRNGLDRPPAGGFGPSADDRRRGRADHRDVRARRRHLRRPAEGLPVPAWLVERVAHRRRRRRRVVLGERLRARSAACTPAA